MSQPALQSAVREIESLVIPAVVLDPGYRILAANPAYSALYGDAEQLLSQSCFKVSHGYQVPCDQAGESCPMARADRSGHPARVLHVHQTNKGAEHIFVEARPVRADGHIIAFIETHRQIPVGARANADMPLIGQAPSFTRMMEQVLRVAPSEAPALILGESGTGKHLIARALHESAECAGDFVTVECSGLLDGMFENRLFGYEKGAFPGAERKQIGQIEAAAGGTLFLDEVGDIPLADQAKLVNLIETSAYHRVGGVEMRRAAFRLVCATHRDLEAMVARGEFRQDLYYRINIFPIKVPALRERRQDIPLLAEYLLDDLWQEPSPRPRIGNDTLQVLTAYAWPGNIRQLRNVLQRALLLTDGADIQLEALPEISGEDQNPQVDLGRIVTLDEHEQHYLLQVAARFPGEKRELAKLLGVSERTLYRKLEQARKAYEKRKQS
ncbi:MAG: sigma-54-dependent Fis family transcriptional regulator [Gammaproteobacteria bacterium]|nr:sigma-54-dependent Fis family transcriptional regulator [Gammaproteobacteria bacterium]MCP5137042.1 sigma-54-dependent Fis family transcriptional regulator [Gammaproteobacteria bacterium]